MNDSNFQYAIVLRNFAHVSSSMNTEQCADHKNSMETIARHKIQFISPVSGLYLNNAFSRALLRLRRLGKKGWVRIIIKNIHVTFKSNTSISAVERDIQRSG